MATVEIWNLEHEKVDTLELDDEVFGQQSRDELVWEVVKCQKAGMRKGCASTKTRGEVSGTGAKPYKQKRTGRARQGTLRGPHQRGGGVAFGPRPRSYAYKMPKKVRKMAMRSVLSDQARNQRLWVLKDMELPGIKTKHLHEIMSRFGLHKALLVDRKDNQNLKLSTRNLPGFMYRSVEGLNLVDLVGQEHLVISVSTVKQLEGLLKS